MSNEPATARWSDLVAPALLPRAALVCLGIWLNAADSMVTTTIMPSVGADLGGWAWFGWAVALYLTGSIVAGASTGQLSARLGLRATAVLSALAYAGGCALSAASPDIVLFMAGRLVQGLGSGWIVASTYVAIERMFPQGHWARMLALGAGVWGVATLLGPLVGGVFAQAGFWRGAFWMFAAQGLVFAIAAPALIPAKSAGAPAAPLAWRTLATLAAGIGAVAAANVTHGAATALGLCAAGLALVFAAALLNRRAGEGLLPRGVADLGSREGAGFAMIFLFSAAAAPLGVYGAAILQAGHGLSPLAAGYAIGMEAVGWTAAAMVIANQPERRHGAIILAGGVAIAAGSMALAVAVCARSLPAIVAGAALLGAGFGLVWSFTTARVLSALGPDERSTGAGAVPTTQLIGGAVGAALAGAVANLAGLTRGAGLDLSGAPLVFAAFVPIALLGLAAAARLAAPARELR